MPLYLPLMQTQSRSHLVTHLCNTREQQLEPRTYQWSTFLSPDPLSFARGDKGHWFTPPKFLPGLPECRVQSLQTFLVCTDIFWEAQTFLVCTDIFWKTQTFWFAQAFSGRRRPLWFVQTFSGRCRPFLICADIFWRRIPFVGCADIFWEAQNFCGMRRHFLWGADLFGLRRNFSSAQTFFFCVLYLCYFVLLLCALLLLLLCKPFMFSPLVAWQQLPYCNEDLDPPPSPTPLNLCCGRASRAKAHCQLLVRQIATFHKDKKIKKFNVILSFKALFFKNDFMYSFLFYRRFVLLIHLLWSSQNKGHNLMVKFLFTYQKSWLAYTLRQVVYKLRGHYTSTV